MPLQQQANVWFISISVEMNFMSCLSGVGSIPQCMFFSYSNKFVGFGEKRRHNYFTFEQFTLLFTLTDIIVKIIPLSIYKMDAL